ncbi:Zinc-type alcohol dehydrogenase-like protein [Colletotrichum siamense]|uniref:Zinc-type alcohol dehydrogenase-like protein n=1 Tax=Colletotrichum siamense TaxID=690259 RepID=A0A9P5EIL1_COLSI|nr:Zinc-type alcohol dehydrogenase-like protein [Colletotrichum siamense]KAF4842290.1 Zinc-type alcohol dehydrogenase-like protein [Colletotrichum siamense]
MTRGLYPFAMKTPVTAGSNGAGSDLAVGPKVIDFTAVHKICTSFNEFHQASPKVGSDLGGAVDGTLCKYAVFPDHDLVLSTSTLSSIEASTLSDKGDILIR